MMLAMPITTTYSPRATDPFAEWAALALLAVLTVLVISL
jgi:hypothetical protein